MRAAALALAAGLLAGACTAGGDPSGSSPSPTSPPTTAAPAEPGTYAYVFNGVSATSHFEGAEGSLEVRNATGARLAAPGISIVLAENGRTLRTSVEGASPLGRGARRGFDVTLPRTLDPRDVGLVLLAFGGDAWGALSPEG
jgi:hypothetical protein